MRNNLFYGVALAVAVAFSASGAMADEAHHGPMKNLASGKVKEWIADAKVINAVKAQNDAHASLAQADIDKLDKQWRAETEKGGGPLIDKVLANDLSAFLKQIKEKSGGLYTEIFVMDNKGLNVGQSDVTSDYWQGDEGKWKNTYSAGAGSVDISEVEQDESTQRFQSQLSLPVVDADGKPIGAVTIGVDMEALGV